MASKGPDGARLRLLYPLALAAILLLATFLRFYRLDASSLWSDEGNTWAMLERSFGEIAAAAAADIHPPGYYWLLKGWAALFGHSAWAMRSFSALAGILLVVVVERIGRLIAAAAGVGPWLPLLGALAVAANPLLVYYSQEARMYMLLALLGAGVFWTLLGQEVFREDPPLPGSPSSSQAPPFREVSYILLAALGLWTHYSFAIVLAAANLAWLGRWLALRYVHSPLATWRTLAAWIGLNLIPVLLFLPWLPTAVVSVLNWPKGGVAVSVPAGLAATLRTLVFGPLHTTLEPAWPWLLAGAVLPLLGLAGLMIVRTARHRVFPKTLGVFGARGLAWPLALWLGLPIALMASLGLYSDAFLKFLITAAPAWCLLAACAPLLGGGGRRAFFWRARWRPSPWRSPCCYCPPTTETPTPATITRGCQPIWRQPATRNVTW